MLTWVLQEGASLGIPDGSELVDGTSEGCPLGWKLGDFVGLSVGDVVGNLVGC